MIGQQAPPLGPDDLSSALNQALLAALLALPPVPRPRHDARGPVERAGRAAVERGRRPRSREVRVRPPLTDEKLIKDLGDSLLRIRERNLKRQVQQLEFLIRETTTADDREETRRLHELMTTYTAQKRHIQKLLNMRSIAGVLAQRQAAIAARTLSPKRESNAKQRRTPAQHAPPSHRRTQRRGCAARARAAVRPSRAARRPRPKTRPDTGRR